MSSILFWRSNLIFKHFHFSDIVNTISDIQNTNVWHSIFLANFWTLCRRYDNLRRILLEIGVPWIDITISLVVITASDFRKDLIGHLICTLISENQGLEKLRSVSNLRKISGPAHLNFFSVHLSFFSVCHLDFFRFMV